MKNKPQHIPIKGTKAEEFLIPQQDGYSCAAACLASIAAIFNLKSKDYDFFKKELTPSKRSGVPNAKFAEAAAKHLPCKKSGEGAYTGGVAVANIMSDGIGHYVVFLAQEKNRIAYYDPEIHALVVADRKDIKWVSQTEKLKEWAIDAKKIPHNSINRWLKLAKNPVKPAT